MRTTKAQSSAYLILLRNKIFSNFKSFRISQWGPQGHNLVLTLFLFYPYSTFSQTTSHNEDHKGTIRCLLYCILIQLSVKPHRTMRTTRPQSSTYLVRLLLDVLDQRPASVTLIANIITTITTSRNYYFNIWLSFSFVYAGFVAVPTCHMPKVLTFIYSMGKFEGWRN